MSCRESRDWVLNFFQSEEDNTHRRLSRYERQSGLLVTFLTLLVGVLILVFFILAESEANAMLGWMIYYFVFWNLPMQDYKLGLAKREEKHLLSWIFLSGFHLLFLEAFCIKMICKGLSRRDKFSPVYLLAVGGLPLPVLVLSLPVKVYLDMSRRVVGRVVITTREANCPIVDRSRPRPRTDGTRTEKNAKRGQMPLPSYSEIEDSDLPAYADLEFETEQIEESFVILDAKAKDDKKQAEFV